MKKILIRGGIVLIVLLIIALFTLAFFLDSAIKKGVETFGPQLTKVSVKLESVSVSILSGAGAIKGLVVGNPEGFKTPSAISIGTASLALNPGSLLSDKIVIKHMHLESPEITFEGGLKENNLTKILDNLNAASGGGASKPAPETKPAGPGKKLEVDDFLIKGAKVNISLTAMGGKVIPMTIPDIHLSNLGTGPDGITAAELTRLALNEIIAAASKAAASDAVENVKKQANEVLKDPSKAAEAVKGVGDLFKKKK